MAMAPGIELKWGCFAVTEAFPEPPNTGVILVANGQSSVLKGEWGPFPCRADLAPTNRGDAAAATPIFLR